ncbi:uncharacterized protein LOC113296073 [Papaver somniferum]|uniref:uncharacterized protein LOC113296073 n=1 Tax=Papaver somniferum TaxID=3469 RepID=UPI000E6FDB5D|nr:uncharacterized protein LOC113296073 [Papaver somniferum]
MKTHLGTCPENPNKKLKGQKSLVFPPPRPRQSSQLVVVSYDKDMCRRRLTKFVVIDELAFRIVEGGGFRRYSEQLEPRFKVPSRMTIYRDLLIMYKDEKEKLKK